MGSSQNHKKSLTEQAIVLFIGNALALALGIAVPMVLVRVFTKAEYGVYRQLLLVFTTLLPVGQMGVTQGLYYFLPREPDKRSALITQTALFVLVAGFLVLTFLLLFRNSIARIMNSPEMVQYFDLLSLFIFFMIISSFLESLMVAEGKAHFASLVRVSSALLRSIAVVLTAVFTRSILGVLTALLCFSLARCLFQTFYLVRHYSISLKNIDLPFWRRQFKYSIPVGLANLAWLFQTKLHSFFVSALFTPATFAVYSVGTYNLPFIGLITTSVSNVVTPELAVAQKHEDWNRILSIWNNAVRKMNLFFFPTFMFFLLMSQEFIIVLFGPKYVDSVPIFQISLLGLLIASINTGSVLNAYAETTYQFRIALLRLPVAVLLLYVFTKRWGIIGAVSADMIVSAGFRFIVLGKVAGVMELSIIRLLEPRKNGKIMLASLLAGLPLLYFKACLELPLVPLLAVSGLIFGVLYCFFGFLLKISSRSEVASFCRALLPGIGALQG